MIAAIPNIIGWLAISFAKVFNKYMLSCSLSSFSPIAASENIRLMRVVCQRLFYRMPHFYIWDDCLKGLVSASYPTRFVTEDLLHAYFLHRRFILSQLRKWCSCCLEKWEIKVLPEIPIFWRYFFWGIGGGDGDSEPWPTYNLLEVWTGCKTNSW